MPSDFAVYLPQSEDPSPWPVDVLGAGSALHPPGAPYPKGAHPADHRLDWRQGRVLEEYQVLFITQGSGSFESEACSPFRLNAPALFLLFPGVWHRYRPEEKTGWQEHWVAFRGPFADQLLQSGTISPQRPLYNVGHSDALLSQIQLVHDEVRSEALGFRSIASSALMQILALAIHLPIRHEEEGQPLRDSIRKACVLMRERSDQALHPEDLAGELGIGYTYFRRLFKKYTGISPKRYHAQLRLLRVKRLLRESSRSVAEIADLLGFNSPFHLSNWFKKETQLSPQHWRQESRGSLSEPPLP